MNPIWLHSDFIDSYSQFIIRTLLPLKDRCGSALRFLISVEIEACIMEKDVQALSVNGAKILTKFPSDIHVLPNRLGPNLLSLIRTQPYNNSLPLMLMDQFQLIQKFQVYLVIFLSIRFL